MAHWHHAASKTAEMLDLIASGLTAAQVAKKFGVSRFVVLGRVRRAGRAKPCDKPRFDWNEEAVANLQTWRTKDGLNCSEIAKRLGTTAASVKGKIGALRIPPPERKPGWTRTSRLTPLPRLVVPVPEQIPPARDHAGNLITILTIRDGQCKFPYGEGTELHFCANESASGTSWCPYHARIVWSSVPKIVKQVTAEAA